MFRRLIPIFIFAFLCFICQGQHILTAKEKIADVEFLQNGFRSAHPSSERYTPKDSMFHLFDELKEQIQNGKGNRPFRVEIANIVSHVRCVHTSLLRENRLTRRFIRKNGLPRILPTRFYYDGRDLWIAQAYIDSLKMLEGTRVVSMDQRPVNEVIKQLLEYRSGDGYSKTFTESYVNWSANFSNLYKRYFLPDSTVQLDIVKRNGSQGVIQLPFLPIRIPSSPASDQVILFQSKNHKYWIDSISGMGIIAIESFNPQRKVKRFYRNVFNHIQENHIQNLVIDLRGNTGGNLNEAKRLLSYMMDTSIYYTLEKKKTSLGKYANLISNYYAIANYIKRKIMSFAKKYRQGNLFIIEQKKKPRKKNRFEGQIFVLQDGFTTSSSSFVSTYLKEKMGAVVIGSESGGGSAGNNGLFYATSVLPHSKIKVRLPQYWLNYQLIPDRGRGVIPDIEVDYTISDILEKKDLEMEQVRSYIKQNVIK